MFIRELISNASDALEKLRYFQLNSQKMEDSGLPLEIHIQLDEKAKTFTIQVHIDGMAYIYSKYNLCYNIASDCYRGLLNLGYCFKVKYLVVK